MDKTISIAILYAIINGLSFGLWQNNFFAGIVAGTTTYIIIILKRVD